MTRRVTLLWSVLLAGCPGPDVPPDLLPPTSSSDAGAASPPDSGLAPTWTFALSSGLQCGARAVATSVTVGEQCTGVVTVAFPRGVTTPVTVSAMPAQGITFAFSGLGAESSSVVLAPLNGVPAPTALVSIRFSGLAPAGPISLTLVAEAAGVTRQLVLPMTVRSRGPFGASRVAVGGEFACALDPGGRAWCWGKNTRGQLGVGDTVNRSVPTLVAGDHRFQSLHVTQESACGLEANGTLWCWGRPSIGPLVVGADLSEMPALVPVSAAPGFQFVKFSIGETQRCGLTAAGTLHCWGGNGNTNVYLGNGPFGGSRSAVLVAGGHAWKDVAVGGSGACALTTGGVAYCWGFNLDGFVGDGTTTHRGLPTAVMTPVVFQALGASHRSVCGLAIDGSTWCWGSNDQLGTGSSSQQLLTPTRVLGSQRFISLAVSNGGAAGACGLEDGGVSSCWGHAAPQGWTSSPIVFAPKALETDLRFEQVSVTGGGLACGVASSPVAGLFCWATGGSDYRSGQLGTGDTNKYVGPIPVSLPDGG